MECTEGLFSNMKETAPTLHEMNKLFSHQNDSDENAARVANHDLKSLVRVLHCWEPGIHLPLMTLVDYRGYRVVCMSLLPINQRTLVHGSSDAGKTLRFDEATQEKLKHVCFQAS